MVRLISSFFYIGYLPRMSGTYASITGLLIFFLLKGNPFYLQTLTGLIVFLGFLTCGRAEKVLNEKDSRKIVIDEVSGMLICCCFIPATFFHALAAFFLFRVFDILKPFPIKRLEGIKGSLGVMLDDILAAFYALAALNIIDYIRSILI
ncbi:MAG: phosphatidylglycerophosphatase A [Candidatus Omnitrophica bacterium]|nr:phosphatidylglycerophosphatase A [Candidatus Omnitrophota bacterium]